jgi:excisionase family DNA binding protein
MPNSTSSQDESGIIISTMKEYLDELKNEVRNTRTPWFTIKEASKYLKRSETFIRENIKIGKIRVSRFGSKTGNYRIHRKNLDLFVMYGRVNVNSYEESRLAKLNRLD